MALLLGSEACALGVPSAARRVLLTAVFGVDRESGVGRGGSGGGSGSATGKTKPKDTSST
jgi:hypothetical protein